MNALHPFPAEEPQLGATQLRIPSTEHLAHVMAALQREHAEAGRKGLHPDLVAIATNPEGFVSLQLDHTGARGPVTLPDGSQAERVPDTHRWIWDLESNSYSGVIALRWWPGHGLELPAHCLGHIGYSVMPWQRRKGHATRALAMMTALAQHVGLRSVTVTADEENTASVKVIEAVGGVLQAKFHLPKTHVSFNVRQAVRYSINVAPAEQLLRRFA